jgi:hypothetical protein
MDYKIVDLKFPAANKLQKKILDAYLKGKVPPKEARYQ